MEWARPTLRENDLLQLKAGDVVTVAQHEGLEQKVVLVEAEVDAVTTYRGVPVYRLKDLEGKPAQKGDSGGGIWHKGKFVGNLWYRMKVEPTLLSLFSTAGSDQSLVETGIESLPGYPPLNLSLLEQLGSR
jgi:hypothetical protein